MASLTLPETMLAAQIIELNQPHEIRTIPTPSVASLNPHDILLKIAVASICHSDVAYVNGELPGISLPVTASHEGVGVLVAKGSAVNHLEIGDRILAGMTFGRCGECEICKGPEEYRHYCEKRETMMSVQRNGALQEYLVVDGREAAKIPDGMSFVTAAPLACAGVTSWRGVKQCELKPGEWIGIVGSGGGLGHLAVQFAKKCFGLKVVGIDAKDEGLALTKEVGADVVIDAREGKEKVAEKVREITDGKGVRSTLNLSGAKSAIKTSGAITRTHGLIVQVAVTPEVNLDIFDCILRDIRLKGSFMASQAEMQETLDAFVEHNLKVENNVFHGIKEAPRAIQMLEKGEYRGKACIVINEDAPGVMVDSSRI